jgi:hypothetical protein
MTPNGAIKVALSMGNQEIGKKRKGREFGKV